MNANGRLEFGGSFGGISAQSHDVAETARVDAVGNFIELVPGVTDAGEMRHDGKPKFLPEQLAHLRGPLAGAAARPGHSARPAAAHV